MSGWDAPSTWALCCPWCDWYIIVAMRSGAGEEAARLMHLHIADEHGRTWDEFRATRAAA